MANEACSRLVAKLRLKSQYNPFQIMNTGIHSSLSFALYLTVGFLSAGECLAQAPKESPLAATAKPRELGEFVKNLPKADMAKLRGRDQNVVAQELTKKIIAAEVQKEGTFRVAVRRVEDTQFPDQTEMGWRVECEHEAIKQGSITLELWAWVAVRKDPDGVLQKVRPGQDFTVTGTVKNADIRMVGGKPQLNVNIQATSLRAGK